MDKNNDVDCDGGFAHGPQGLRAERPQNEDSAYLAGRNLGYHLGYNLGFESGHDKGYAEGSTLGYNNGFLAALKLMEGGDDAPPDQVTEVRVCRTIQKLISRGLLRIYLSGSAAAEVEGLFKLIDIRAAVSDRGIKI